MNDNKLIAEFMGMRQGKENEIRWANDWFESLDPNGHIFQSGLRHEHLRFNTSWDWLMPVVDKIERECEGVPQQLMHLSLFSTRAEVHKAVLDFISNN